MRQSPHSSGSTRTSQSQSLFSGRSVQRHTTRLRRTEHSSVAAQQELIKGVYGEDFGSFLLWSLYTCGFRIFTQDILFYSLAFLCVLDKMPSSDRSFPTVCSASVIHHNYPGFSLEHGQQLAMVILVPVLGLDSSSQEAYRQRTAASLEPFHRGILRSCN